MPLTRREFAVSLTGLGGAAAFGSAGTLFPGEPGCDLPAPIRRLKPMTEGIRPIGDEERRVRIEKGQRLMTEQGVGAVLIEPGTTMAYFTGVRWSSSERTFAVLIPARGEPGWICPAFEEARARELIRFGTDVRTWQEDESPFRLIAGLLRDRGVFGGRLGLEEEVRFFLLDGLRKEAAGAELVSATPVTAGCRMYKSSAELALMQRASDMTIAAFKAAFATLRAGMTQYDLQNNMLAALRQVGGDDPWALVGLGKSSAFPHGTVQPQRLTEGDIVLLDAGCALHGYQSDITRTTVFGRPSARQTEIWNLERRAQDAAFAAARVGVPCEAVDAAARKVITDAGFGPDYRVPGLPHRTGHGIGMDGHEWTYFVRGNSTPIAPGMCFSDEPTIAIYGEFGIRLEDCLYITEQGPRFFSEQSVAIDRPLG
ncbi:MAG TPA: Xaa-Pro peptidase family protein [Gemmatimonadales bacterium]|jgi:Xaa-Pro dipeptidase|nr:Xaa-Pro peptidase family protein [Gemmatimonadales bacterium]